MKKNPKNGVQDIFEHLLCSRHYSVHFHALSHPILRTALLGRYYFYFCFARRKLRHKEVNNLSEVIKLVSGRA